MTDNVDPAALAVEANVLLTAFDVARAEELADHIIKELDEVFAREELNGGRPFAILSELSERLPQVFGPEVLKGYLEYERMVADSGKTAFDRARRSATQQ